MRLIGSSLAILLLAGLPTAAHAQSCSFSMTNVDFGSATLTGGGTVRTTGTLSATCTGTANQRIRICANFGEGTGGTAAGGDPRLMTAGASQVRYQLTTGRNTGNVWGSYLWPYSFRPPDLDFRLANNGQGSFTRTVNASARRNQSTAAAGIHTSLFTGNAALIDYGYRNTFNCSATPSTRAQQVPFTVLMNNVVGCSVAATAMNFGDATVLAAARNATSTLSVTCTRGTSYSLGLSNGSGGGTGPTQRRMTSTSTSDYVTYGIYRNAARTQAWGDTVGVNTASGNGNGRTQTFTAYGRIPAQASPAANTYTDTIIATITY